ncbi:MAG: hypothetical protein ISR90_05800 [Candidatus Marinimicrobia bacterium]|nr:hypothetical protein [Candidatus Neomarinimicrobiota bacterium]MBL7023547.1 hypothetical protein [Candidatus Neomarinimicrobiota bacterium]MBL7109571.1 hypothetical protein [Candidatus Neomarinimicrobiota bacterium]
MKKTLIYQEFENLAEQLEIRLVVGKGSFSGDYCLVEEDKYIVVNKNKPIEQKIKRLALAFSKLDLSDIYVKPAIRELIDAEKKQTLFE